MGCPDAKGYTQRSLQMRGDLDPPHQIRLLKTSFSRLTMAGVDSRLKAMRAFWEPGRLKIPQCEIGFQSADQIRKHTDEWWITPHVFYIANDVPGEYIEGCIVPPATTASYRVLRTARALPTSLSFVTLQDEWRRLAKRAGPGTDPADKDLRDFIDDLKTKELTPVQGGSAVFDSSCGKLCGIMIRQDAGDARLLCKATASGECPELEICQFQADPKLYQCVEKEHVVSRCSIGWDDEKGSDVPVPELLETEQSLRQDVCRGRIFRWGPEL